MGVLRRGLVGAVGAGLVLATTAGPALAGPTPGGARAATASGPTTGHPYAVAPSEDGTAVTWTDTRTRATGSFAGIPFAGDLSVSPSGATVAFTYDDTDAARAGVGVVTAATGAVKRLTSVVAGSSATTFDEQPAVSPSGSTVAFIRNDSSGEKVMTVPVGGGSLTAVATSQGQPFALTYASDGGLLYASGSTTCALSKHPTSGSDTCVLTDTQLDTATGGTGSVVRSISASRGSSRIALVVSFDAGSKTHRQAVAVLTPGSTPKTTVLSASTVATSDSSDAFYLDTSPNIDPTGTEVVYEEDSDDDSAAWSVDVATGTHRARVVPTTYSSVGAYVPTATVTPSVFVALATPYRVLDTRKGVGAAKARIAAGKPVDVDTTKGSGVPSTATAVALNLTGTDASTTTFLQAYPTPTTAAAAPNVSNVNLVPGQTAANAVTVADTSGKVRFGVGAGAADAIADVTGYYVPLSAASETTATFVPEKTPVRVVDTRKGTGVPQGALGAGGTADWTVPSSVPTGATAVVLNVGGVAHARPTYVTAFPKPASGSATPSTSTLSLAAGETRANLATVTLPASRAVRFYNAAGTADVYADLVGYYVAGTSGAAYVPLAPARAFDTRSGMNELGGAAATVPAGGYRDLRATGSLTTGAGQTTVAATATAIQVNLTAVAPSGTTFLSLYATPTSGSTAPTFSTLNVASGRIVANAAITAVGTGGQARVYNAVGTVNALVDVAGYFVPAA